MTTQSDGKTPTNHTTHPFRVINVLIIASIVVFSFAVRPNQPRQRLLIALGIVISGIVAWRFLRFLQTTDGLRRDINNKATSVAFVGSLLLTLIVGLAQRFGLLPGASLFVPAAMLALWSVALVFYAWRPR